MDEKIIIPIILQDRPALEAARGFGVKVDNAFKSIKGYKDGKIELSLNIKTGPGVEQLHNMGKAASSAGDGLKKVVPGASQAQYALLNLNRVVQDSPYGFIGIINNVNPLFESFVSLRTTTGSTSAALKAMGSSMIGPGGLGIALAAVGAALTFAQIGLDMWTRKKKEAKAATDAATEANKAFASEVAKGLVTLTSLVGIVQSNTSSLKDKDLALKQINQDYAPYLTNLGAEGATLKNIAEAYDLVIEKMLKQAVVKGLQEQISKEVEKTAAKIIRLEQAEKARQATAERNKNRPTEEAIAQQKLNNYLARRNQVQADGFIAQNRYNTAVTKSVKDASDYESNVKRATDSLKQQLKPLIDLTDKYDELGLKLNKTPTPKGPDNAKRFAEAKKQLDDEIAYLDNQLDKGLIKPLDYAKQRFDLVSKAAHEFVVQFGQAPDSDLIKGLEEQMRSLQGTMKLGAMKFETTAEIAARPNLVMPAPKVTINESAWVKEIREKQQVLLDAGIQSIYQNGVMVPVSMAIDGKSLDVSIEVLKQQGEAFKSAVTDVTSDAIGSFAEGVGEALGSGNGLANAFAKVGQTLGRAMQNFGKQLITGGVKILIAKNSLKFAISNPYLMIAAGIALAATGAAVTSALQKSSNQRVTGLAHGGGVAGPGFALVGEHSSTSRNNPELWGRFDQFKKLFGGMLDEHVSRTNRTMPGMEAVGAGGYPSEIRLVADGDMLVGLIERVTKRQKRVFA